MKSPREFLANVTRTRLSLIGSVITTVTALVFIAVFVAELTGFQGGPYVGLIAFVAIPLLFVFGLVLIPLGLWLDRRSKRKSGIDPGPAIMNLSSDSTKRKIRIFFIATALNVAILLLAAFQGFHVMESNEFCGTACHTVMSPEFTSYKLSPHSRVNCVECHIGPGSSWFVKSKITGSWQLVSVALGLYPKPIPTPVHNLRPSRDTCEQCHWPTKFVGDRLKVIKRYKEDEANTELTTVLMMKVGGIGRKQSHGIHWHVDPNHVVRYRADAKREKIYEIELTEDGKPTKRWTGPEFDKPEAKLATEWRTMDCVDCHNRPAHTYDTAENSIDRAFADGRLDREIPFLRREGMKAVSAEYATQDAAREGIKTSLAAFYSKTYPAVASEKVAAASAVLGQLYANNVFPQMNIKWGSYPNQISHVSVMGCLRCHNGDHKTADDKVITSECDSCHTMLADGEENPEILKTLTGEQ